MRISSHFRLLGPIFFLALAACSESPQPAVSSSLPGQNQGVEAVTGGVSVELQALVFQGRESLSGRTCRLFLAAYDSGVSREWVVRPELIIHGEEPLDMIVNFYQYDLDQNIYSFPESPQGSSALALGGARLSNSLIPGDMNQLSEYEREFILLQSLRLDFDTQSYEDFLEAINDVLGAPENLLDRTNELNLLNRMVIKIKHYDHYDAALCRNFELQAVMPVIEFQIHQEVKD